MVEAATGIPLPGSEVVGRWTTSSGEVERTVPTDDQARYELHCVPDEISVSVFARVARFQSEHRDIAVTTGSVEVDLEISLEDGEGRDPGRLVGRILDREGGQGVAGASAYLRPLSVEPARSPNEGWTRQATSSAEGTFRMVGIDHGRYEFMARHVGYGPVEREITVLPDRTTDVRIELAPDPVELEPLFVVTTRSRKLERRGFYERREWGEKLGIGSFFTVEDIERRMPLRITHMVQDLAGVEIECPRGLATRGCHVKMRRASPLYCRHAAVYVDGIKMVDPETSRQEPVDAFVHPNDIAGIEVYTSPAQMPAEFGGAASQCGALVLWTKR